MLQWKGPFVVSEAVYKFDYRVKVGDRILMYHINLLQKYEEREDRICAKVAVIEAENNYDTGVVKVNCNAVGCNHY
jgi:hypothetical protein